MMRAETQVFIAASMDGFVARPGGELDWLMQAQASAPPGDDFGYAAFMAGIDAIVMGRHTLETVMGFDPWPYAQPVIALSRQTAPVLPAAVVGRVQWSSESPARVLQRLAAEGRSRVYLDGGQLIQSFLRDDLVDAITLTHIPVLIGQGRPLWGPLPADRAWCLTGVQHWANGFVQTRYRREGR